MEKYNTKQIKHKKRILEGMRKKYRDVVEWLKKQLFLTNNMTTVRKTHYVKCESEFFNDVVDDFKTFEIRKNDRDYQPGDDIVLREYDKELKKLTGREERVSIIYMLEDYPGIEPGYCILGIERYY